MALDFLILYEHTVREYESDLLLKLELERRGYTVRIRQLLDAKDLRLFGKDKPEVLVASCMYDNEAINSHVYNNIGRCNKIVNLHWEQMLSDTQEEGDWFNMNGNAKRCVQTCWGQRTAQRLQAHGMDAKNTPVTGAVMMDFLRPEFKGYFKDKETLCKEFGLDPAKQLHLYISSFGYASMTDQEVAELSKMAGTDFSGFARTNRVSMEKTLAWFDRYLGDHPEVELVYRRHPSEWKCKALDELAAKARKKEGRSTPPVVLVAPSWGNKGCLNICGPNFLLDLAKAGYDVILRPHPQSLKVETEMLDTIHEMLRDYPNVSFDTEMDATASMSRADVMISDKSCVRFDFAFLYEKPVITLDIPVRNPELYEVADLGVIWEDTVAARLGEVVSPEDFNNIVPVVERALKTPSSAIAAFREESVACWGRSGEAIAQWTVDTLARMDAEHAAEAAATKTK